jgi:large subunit ribosomal protein L31
LTNHPELHVIGVECASCGSTFTLRSTATSLGADVCSNCHPAYTGLERATVAGTRIDRFNRRRGLRA